MPTSKPRVNVTLPVDTYQALKAYASATDMSMSSVLSDLANKLAPTFSASANVVSIARNMDKEGRDLLVSSLQDLESSLYASVRSAKCQDVSTPVASNTGAKLSGNTKNSQNCTPKNTNNIKNTIRTENRENIEKTEKDTLH